MAENKKSVIIYADLLHTVNKMPNDKAGMLLKTILEYVNDLNPIVDDLIVEIAFEPIKQQMKRDLKKWEAIKDKRSDAGKASAESRRLTKENQQNSTNSTSVKSVQQNSTNSTVTVNGTVTVNDDSNKPPTHNFFTIYDFEKIEIGENEFTLLATRQGNKTIQEVKKLLPAFLKIQKGLNKITWQDEADAKKHFINWLKKQPKSFYNNSPSN